MSLVFIIGTGRCGSSFIHEIISKHEDVGFISNIDDRLYKLNLKGKYNNTLFRGVLGNFTMKGRHFRYAPSEAYNLISEKVSPIYAKSSRDLDENDVTPWLNKRFTKFMSNRQAIQGKQVFSHKYTGWSRIGFFHEIFPDAKFVHIVRDGRAVANSLLQMPWWGGYRGPENWLLGDLVEPYRSEWVEGKRSYTLLAGIAWKMLMDSYEQSEKKLDTSNYMLLRYEDFLDSPREVITLVLHFMGVDWSSSFEKQFSKQKIQTSRQQAFEKELTKSQLNELQGCLGSMLEKYGYEG